MSDRMRNVLLIGGFADGQWRKITVDKHGTPLVPTITVTEEETVLARARRLIAHPLREQYQPRSATYHAVPLRAADGWYHVYATEEARDLVIERLLEGYRPQKKEDTACDCSRN